MNSTPSSYIFESHSIRTATIDGEIWFVAKDIALALEYPSSSIATMNKLTSHIPAEWKGRSQIPTPGGKQRLLCLSEQGMYFFINRSDKPKALPFQKWVAGEVLPQIRKTGSYSIGQSIGEDGFNCLSNLIEGKTTKLTSKCRRSAQSKLWSQVHKAFGVRSGHDIPAEKLDSVRNFIAAYAIEGEYLPSKGQSELGLAEPFLAEPFLGLDHLKLSGDRNIPDGRKLLKEMGKFMPAKAQPLLVELEATMVRQWTEVDESLHRILSAQNSINTIQRSMESVQSSVNAAQTYMSRCRGQISELPDQV